MTRWLRVEHDGQRFFAEQAAAGEPLHVIADAPWLNATRTGETVSADAVRLLAPATPSKIVCVGRNYRAHAAELGNDVPAEPLLFLKPPSALCGPGASIIRPIASELVHHEGELAAVIGVRLTRADEATAGASVFAFTCANDVTARDIQRREGKFTRAKGFDTFCPLGPALVSADAVGDPQRLPLEVSVDGSPRQQASTADMVFPVARLLSFISHVMTLEPGDLVLTGTPEGVGPLAAGQTVRVAIEGLGELVNPVEDAPGSGAAFP